MMAELAENVPVYSFLPSINNFQTSKARVILFGFRKENPGHLVVPSSQLYLFFFMNKLNTSDRKALYSCIVDCDCGRVGYNGWTEFSYVRLELD